MQRHSAIHLALFLTFSTLITNLEIAAANPQQDTEQKPARHVPQAKTHQEYVDYNADYALSGGAAVEKAADEFAAKYPQSELREYLYLKALHEYQNENNSAKILALGEKVLTLDPDNLIALVLTATVLSDSLSDGDTDRAQKIAQIKTNSQRALETADTAFMPPPNATPEQIQAYKETLQSMAHSAVGIMELKTGDDANAEKDLRAAADLNTTQPDPYVWYHLALSQDHRGEYKAALLSVTQALKYTVSNPELDRLARSEQRRLEKLAGSPASP